MNDAWTWETLGGLAILVAGSMIGIAPSVMGRAPTMGWWIVALAPLPLIIWNVFWVMMTNPPDNARRAISLSVGAIAGVVMLLGITEALQGPANAQPSTGNGGPMADPKDTPPGIPPGASGNFNFGQRGGNNNQYYFNQAPEKLKFSDAVGVELLAKIPKDDKPVNVMAIGSPADQQVGVQIRDFLLQNGYTATLGLIGAMSPLPDHALTLIENPNGHRLLVAPSVR